jgi:hypothetical protein
MEGEKQLAFFAPFDLTLLGDIHVPQYLDGARQRVGYAGSLLSQNAGEGSSDHGYLVWDTCTFTSSFVSLLNPWAYVNLYCREDGIIEWYYEGSGIERTMNDLPRQGHITLYGPSRDVLDRMKQWILGQTNSEMKHRIFQRLLTMTTRETVNTAAALTTMSQEEKENNHNIWTWNDVVEFVDGVVISSALRHESEIRRQEGRDHILKILQSNYQEMMSRQERTQTCRDWKILSVHAKHLFGYGDVHISMNEGITGIFGKNSAGKSCLIDILTLLLYNKITRFAHGQTIPPEVIHCQEQGASGEERTESAKADRFITCIAFWRCRLFQYS